MCQLCLNLRFDGHAVDRHARKLWRRSVRPPSTVWSRFRRAPAPLRPRCDRWRHRVARPARRRWSLAWPRSGNRPRLGFAEGDGRLGTRGFEPRLIIALGRERNSSARRLRRGDVPRDPAVTIFDRRSILGTIACRSRNRSRELRSRARTAARRKSRNLGNLRPSVVRSLLLT